MAIEGVVVDRDLRVQRQDLAVAGDDQGVDLHEHGVGGDEPLVEPAEDVDHPPHRAGVDAGIEGESAGVMGLETREGVDVEPGEGIGVARRHFFDVDAAHRRQHHQRLLDAAVEGDRGVVLDGDVRRGLDPHPVNRVALDVHPKDLAGLGLGIGGVVGDLDAPGLAAPSDLHLGLDCDPPADLLGRRPRRLGGLGDVAVGDGDPLTREELLALVLVEIHVTFLSRWDCGGGTRRRRACYPPGRAAGCPSSGASEEGLAGGGCTGSDRLPTPGTS